VLFDGAIRQDVPHAGMGAFERPPHENGPVAVERFLLRAHDRDSLGARRTQELLDAAPEHRRLREPLITHAAVFVARGVGAARTQRIAHELIADAVGGEALGQFLSVELRVEPAERRRPHVR